VVDARGMAASAAALVEGFTRHRDDVEIAGVVFNRVGSEAHAALLRRACDDRFAQPVLGCLPDDARLELPERHLGLVPADELPELDDFLDRAAALVAEHVDLTRLRRIARPFGLGLYGPPARPLRPLGQRIAVAKDQAFAFAYPAVLDGWRTAGAEISFFSPLADESPEPGADAIYLPGGYPELHAGTLAGHGTFVQGLRAAVRRGAFVYGECGGFMVLGQGLTDRRGRNHAMVGLLPTVTSFAEPRLHLGYRRMRLLASSPLGQGGTSYRGHEFHYAHLSAAGDAPPLFEVTDALRRPLGEAGAQIGNVCGSFLHLIDRTADAADGAGRPGHLRVVDS
jgi:cobyrinic acid a,c-diamide synthase